MLIHFMHVARIHQIPLKIKKSNKRTAAHEPIKKIVHMSLLHRQCICSVVSHIIISIVPVLLI